MNREQAIKYMPFILALAEGKTIQYSTGGNSWFDVESPTFVNDTYRIKPFEIEAGKWYECRNGKKAFVGLQYRPSRWINSFVGYIEGATSDGNCSWQLDGTCYGAGNPSPADLIMEWNRKD